MFGIARIFVARTLIIGTTSLARDLVEAINCRPLSRYSIIGVIEEDATKNAREFPAPIMGTLNDLERVVAEQRPSRIVVALNERRQRLPVQQLVQARIRRRILVEDGGSLYERLTGKLAIDSLTPSSVIFSEDFKPSNSALVTARCISVVVAFFGLLVLAPIYGLIAVAIKRNSRDPVMFIQERVGLGGICFRMLKFRTMEESIEKRSEWAGDNGDRITNVGRWLRKFRLDELPQFINIIRGDMNLVGPRPHPLSNYGLFTVVSRNLPECGEPIPYSSLRAMVRPGMTGWAQVRYRYANDLNEEMEKLRYDLFYIKHYSVRMDLRILIETAKIVVSGGRLGDSGRKKQAASAVGGRA